MHGTKALDDAIRRTVPLPRLAYYPAEVAEMLQVSERYVCTLIDRGDLVAVPLGKGRKVTHEDLLVFLQKLRDDEARARLVASGGQS